MFRDDVQGHEALLWVCFIRVWRDRGAHRIGGESDLWCAGLVVCLGHESMWYDCGMGTCLLIRIHMAELIHGLLFIRHHNVNRKAERIYNNSTASTRALEMMGKLSQPPLPLSRVLAEGESIASAHLTRHKPVILFYPALPTGHWFDLRTENCCFSQALDTVSGILACARSPVATCYTPLPLT